MKIINTLKISLLSIIALNFMSCDSLGPYLEKYFNSERPPSQKNQSIDDINDKTIKKSKQPKEQNQETKNEHITKESNIYYIRGNQISLLEARDYPNQYVLSFYRVGKDVIVIPDKNNNSSDYISLGTFLQNWQQTSFIKATLILLRNSSDGFQQDITLDLSLTMPRLNSDSGELSFLIAPHTLIKMDYVSEDLGTAILLFELNE